jgi:hypothetical protein
MTVCEATCIMAFACLLYCCWSGLHGFWHRCCRSIITWGLTEMFGVGYLMGVVCVSSSDGPLHLMLAAKVGRRVLGQQDCCVPGLACTCSTCVQSDAHSLGCRVVGAAAWSYYHIACRAPGSGRVWCFVTRPY